MRSLSGATSRYARAAVPPCVVSPHGVAAGLQGMAAVELERLGVVLHLAPQSGESLYRRGRRLRQQLRNVAASAHAAHRSVKRFAKTMQQADADEGRIRWRDFIAGAGIRHLVRLHLDGTDHVIAPDRHPNPHVVDCFTRSAQARQQSEILVLDIGKMPFDVEQPVVALEPLVGDPSRVKAGANDRRNRERHGCLRGRCAVRARRIEYGNPANLILRGRCASDNDCDSRKTCRWHLCLPWTKGLPALARLCSIALEASGRLRSASSRSIFLDRAGSSMTRMKSGRPSRLSWAKRWPRRQSPVASWLRSGSPISARRLCCGNAPRESRSPARSFGRTAAPPISATRCVQQGTPTCSRVRRDSFSMPTFRAPSSNGSSTMWTARENARNAESSHSERSIPG